MKQELSASLIIMKTSITKIPKLNVTSFNGSQVHPEGALYEYHLCAKCRNIYIKGGGAKRQIAKLGFCNISAPD